MNWQLFLLLSVLSSLVAAALMRILSCEVGFLAYYQNYLLAAILFGLGIGFLDSGLARIRAPAAGWLAYFVAALVLVAIGHFTILPYMGGWKDGTTYFVNTQFLKSDVHNELAITAIVLLAFTLTIKCFVSLGTALGTLISGASAARALKLFALGTVGSLAVYAVSLWLMCPPVVLVGLIVAAALRLSGFKPLNVVLGVLALAAAFSLNFFVAPAREGAIPSSVRRQCAAYSRNFWAPEGHVLTYPLLVDGQPRGFAICTNQFAGDFAVDLGLDDRACRTLATGHESLKDYSSRYFKTPYLARENPRRVLILAAGSGNEVAEALRNGAGEVDAVDWRPWMFELGKEHPLKPFASPSVRMIVCDPRKFLKESTDKYDMIVFGRLESQSSFSPFGLIRTDNFTYTLEAFLDARDNLTADGLIALSFKLYRNWLGLRLAHDLKLGMGKVDAILELPFRSYMFASAGKSASLKPAMHLSFKPGEILSVEEVLKYAEDVRPTFDDWPFTYCSRANLPGTNLFCLIVLMVAMLILARSLMATESDGTDQCRQPSSVFTRQNWRAFLLAAAFMVAAGKSVMTLGFNFGTTWQTSAAGALVVALCVLAAAALARPAGKLPAALVWLLTFAASALDYTFNYESVAIMADPGQKFLAAAVVPTLPAFFMAVLLVRTITDTPSPSSTLGMLFLGLVFGLFAEHGCLSSTISDLAMGGIMLCLGALLVPPQRVLVPAEVQREKPLA